MLNCMGNKLVKFIGIVLSLFAVYAFLIGVKEIFSTEKVYCEYERGVYHSTPYCENILEVGEMDREYMEETGKVVGTKEMSAQDAYYDSKLFMCNYCYSPMERMKRDEFQQKREEYQKKKAN